MEKCSCIFAGSHQIQMEIRLEKRKKQGILKKMSVPMLHDLLKSNIAYHGELGTFADAIHTPQGDGNEAS